MKTCLKWRWFKSLEEKEKGAKTRRSSLLTFASSNTCQPADKDNPSSRYDTVPAKKKGGRLLAAQRKYVDSGRNFDLQRLNCAAKINRRKQVLWWAIIQPKGLIDACKSGITGNALLVLKPHPRRLGLIIQLWTFDMIERMIYCVQRFPLEIHLRPPRSQPHKIIHWLFIPLCYNNKLCIL